MRGARNAPLLLNSELRTPYFQALFQLLKGARNAPLLLNSELRTPNSELRTPNSLFSS